MKDLKKLFPTAIIIGVKTREKPPKIPIIIPYKNIIPDYRVYIPVNNFKYEITDDTVAPEYFDTGYAYDKLESADYDIDRNPDYEYEFIAKIENKLGAFVTDVEREPMISNSYLNIKYELDLPESDPISYIVLDIVTTPVRVAITRTEKNSTDAPKIQKICRLFDNSYAANEFIDIDINGAVHDMVIFSHRMPSYQRSMNGKTTHAYFTDNRGNSINYKYTVTNFNENIVPEEGELL